jgi:hypothetical protein
MLDVHDQKWRDLAAGTLTLQTDNFGLQMFLKWASNRFSVPQPPGQLEKTAADLHGFFVKYERILAKEIVILSN